MKPVFAIMVTYRRFEHFKRSVESLLPTLPDGSKLHIIYNREGQHESDVQYSDYFKRLPSNVYVLDTGTNEGWGASLNEGLALYDWDEFDYVLETNNDVEYEPDWCARAQALADKYPQVGILGLWQHPYHGVRQKLDDLIVKDDMPATAWFFRSKDLQEFLPFPEHGACKTRGGNGEDVAFRDKVQNRLGRWIAAPIQDLVHHMDGYDMTDLGKVNKEYE